MSRFLLDTNILSNAVAPRPSPSLLVWLGDRADEELFISSLTLAEIKRGILQAPAGKRRAQLEAWFEGPEGPSRLFAGRVLAFGEAEASIWADLIAEGRRAGRPRNPLDMILASTALANDCRLVTDNERDFAGLDYFNPLRTGEAGP